MGFTFPVCGKFLFILILRLTNEVYGFEVLVNTSRQAVEFGESLEVTCSTTCNNASIIVEYKAGLNPNRTPGDKWITDRFPSVQKWDLTVPCTVICPSAKPTVKEDKRVVPVYNRNLSIVPPPEVLEVNKSYQLECTGPKVFPNNRLVLTWLRGSETVQHNSTADPGLPEDGPLKNVLNFIASISDDGMVYTCLADLILDSNTTRQIANASVTLQTYSFPEPPTILNRDPVEVNRETTLTCEVSNIYPAEKVRLRWFQNGEEWNSVAIRSNSTTVQATATWTPREIGVTELNCTADFENYPSVSSKNDSITIDMYVFSNPEIHIPITTEGIPVNITCSVFNISGELQLRLKKGSEILVNRSASTGLTIYHTENPRAELNGQQFTCEAELTLDHHSNTIVKRQSATLTVWYSPKKAQISRKQDWIEGESQILTCRADANPVPDVHWIKDGKTISRGERLHVPSVQLGDGGRYICRVSNDIGSTSSSHDVNILYKPRNTTISVNNKTVSGLTVFIREDDEVTMTCHSIGNPHVTLGWEKPSQGIKGFSTSPGGPGVLHISKATSEHKGIYRCRASNELGTDEEQVEITMEGDDWKMALMISLPILILLLLLIVAWILINRARKTGHYKVMNAVPHKNQEIPSGNDQESFPLKEVNSDKVLNNNHSQTNINGVTSINSAQIKQ
ncbi:intercellular adhesion molecule 1-like [Hemitrygon akajei]|uniref:intercellular adhesion molecule 1-like n=1 Tax=Hemitrygon akajei TaxID=2704970 RepID=UPI003BF9D69D